MAFNTLWMTSPRPAPLYPQSLGKVWVDNSSHSQGLTAGEIASVQFNAAQFSSGMAQGSTNTGSALVITAGNTASSESCDYFLGTLGNMKARSKATWRTPPSRTSPPTHRHSPPAPTFINSTRNLSGEFRRESISGTLSWNDRLDLSFYRLAGPPPAITVTFSGTTATISFPTATGGHYTLWSTNAAGLSLPPSALGHKGQPRPATAVSMSFQVTALDVNAFFSVQDH